MHQKRTECPKSNVLHHYQMEQLFGQRAPPIFELDLLRQTKQPKQDKYRQLLGSLEQWNSQTPITNNFRREFLIKNFLFSSLQLSSADLSSSCTQHILSTLSSFHKQNTLTPIQIAPRIKTPRASDDLWQIRKAYRSDLPSAITEFRRKTVTKQLKQNQCKTDKKCKKTPKTKGKLQKYAQNNQKSDKVYANSSSWRKYYNLDQNHKSGSALIKGYKLSRNRLQQKLAKNYYKQSFNNSKQQSERKVKTKTLDPISTPSHQPTNYKIKFHPIRQQESMDADGVKAVDGSLLLINPFDKQYKANFKK